MATLVALCHHFKKSKLPLCPFLNTKIKFNTTSGLEEEVKNLFLRWPPDGISLTFRRGWNRNTVNGSKVLDHKDSLGINNYINNKSNN